MKFIKYLIIILMIGWNTTGFANEKIVVYWAFDIASNQAITLRKLLHIVNSKQSEFTFILENKKGAGGSIAAAEVKRNPDSTLVGMSSSFILRPLVEKENSHSLKDFTPVLIQASDSPLILVTKKGITLDNKEITIGIAGVGTISHVFVNAFQKDSKIKCNIVPFKSSIDAYLAVLGGFIDATVVFPGDLGDDFDKNKISVLAYTGTAVLINYPLAKRFSDLKFNNVKNMTVNYAIFGSTSMPLIKRNKITELLNAANHDVELTTFYKKDMLKVSNLNIDTAEWYQSQIDYWATAIK